MPHPRTSSSNRLVHLIWAGVALACLFVGRGLERTFPTETVSSTPSSPPAKSVRVPTPRHAPDALAAFLNEFLHEQDTVRSSAAFANLLDNFDENNATLIAGTLRTEMLRDHDLEHHYRTFLTAWAERDPHAVLEFLEPLDQVPQSHLRAVVAGWVLLDPASAKQWTESLPLNKAHATTRRAYYSAMARQDLSGITHEIFANQERFDALQKANETNYTGPGLPSQLSSSHLITAVAREVAKLGRDQSIAWVEDLPEGALKSAAFRQVASSFDDPGNRQVMRDWIKKWSHTEHTIGAAGDAIFDLPKEEMPAAAGWANSLGTHGRGGALPHAIDRWAQQDPQAASDFLSTLPNDETRDHAAYKLVGELRWKNLAESLTWAESIKAPSLQEYSLELVAARWLQTDPEGAMAWLPASGLAREQQAELIEEHEDDQ